MLSRFHLFVCCFLVVVVVVFGLFFCAYIDFKTIMIFLLLFPLSAWNGNAGNHMTAAARTGGRYYFSVATVVCQRIP